MGRLKRKGRGPSPPATSPKRTGPGSVTGRQASGIMLFSQPDDWVPAEVQAGERAEPATTSPSDWLPPDLPEPTSSPPPASRKRSTVNQVPPELLAAAPPEAAAPEAPAPEPELAPEPEPEPEREPEPEPEPTARVNVNTASVDELMALPGITRRAAEQIVDHRNAQGPFASVDDLLNVPGFHAARVARLQGQATT